MNVPHDPTISELRPWERRIYDQALPIIARNPEVINATIARELRCSDTAVSAAARAARRTLGVSHSQGNRIPAITDPARFHRVREILIPAPARTSSVRSAAEALVSAARAEGFGEVKIRVGEYEISIRKA